MKVLSGIYVVLAVLSGVAGIALCVQLAGIPGITKMGYVVGFLPAAGFLLGYAATRNSKRIVLHVIFLPLCLLALAFWGPHAFTAFTWDNPGEITDVGQYEGILSRHWENELVSHFPRPIPSDARNVRFSFRPAFLQGGAHVQLRHSAPPGEIRRLYAQFSEKKTKSFIGGEADDDENRRERMPTTSFYTSGSGNNEFPDDYEVMVFDKVPKEEDWTEGYWDHGQSHGVAISKERNEIVYWAESW